MVAETVGHFFGGGPFFFRGATFLTYSIWWLSIPTTDGSSRWNSFPVRPEGGRLRESWSERSPNLRSKVAIPSGRWPEKVKTIGKPSSGFP